MWIDVADFTTLQCWHCDFGTGQRGCDRCSKCDGTGRVFRAKQSWHEMTPAQQARILCADKSFQKFCGANNEEVAAEWVRRACGVKSRSQICEGDKSNDHWLNMVHEFRAWMKESEYLG